MAVAVRATSSRWWRFSAYEVRDGYIRPAPTARLVEYDPWDAFRAAQAGRRKYQPPYQALLDLHRDLEGDPGYGLGFRPPGPTEPTAQSGARLAAWCAAHGLLGLLPDRLETLTLPARWERIPEGKRSVETYVQPICYRANHPWSPFAVYTLASRRRRLLLTPDPSAATGLRADGEERLSRRSVERTAAAVIGAPGRIVLRDAAMGWRRSEPLEATWARYFPGRPRGEYALPLSPPFWEWYAEPLGEFLWAMAALVQVVAGLADAQKQATAAGEDCSRAAQGLQRLHFLVAPVSFALEPTADGLLHRRWVAPSLASLYAMMILEDLADERRAHRCTECQALFFSRAHAACYCSERCRDTRAQRGRRARRRRERPPRDRHGAPTRRRGAGSRVGSARA